MPNTKTGGCPEPGTAGYIICQFQKQRRDDQAKSVSSIVAAKAEVDSENMARGYKLCILSETKETLDYYQDLDNYELFDAQQSADLIGKHVSDYAKTDDSLTKSIADTSKQLQDLKIKLAESNNAACSMRNGLQRILSFTDNGVPAEIKAINDAAKLLSANAGKAADAMVTIAGIHTFANVISLKEYADSLIKSLKTTKGITDGYIKKAGDDLKTAQKELTAVIDTLNTAEFKSFEELGVCNGLGNLIHFICEEECKPIEEVEDICKEVSGKGGKDNPGQAKQSKYDKDEN